MPAYLNRPWWFKRGLLDISKQCISDAPKQRMIEGLTCLVDDEGSFPLPDEADVDLSLLCGCSEAGKKLMYTELVL